ncbi:hypothetical protein RYX36_018686 [Vicia faba]
MYYKHSLQLQLRSYHHHIKNTTKKKKIIRKKRVQYILHNIMLPLIKHCQRIEVALSKENFPSTKKVYSHQSLTKSLERKGAWKLETINTNTPSIFSTTPSFLKKYSIWGRGVKAMLHV